MNQRKTNAAQNNPIAMLFLSELYKKGWGVEKNSEEVLRWSQKARDPQTLIKYYSS